MKYYRYSMFVFPNRLEDTACYDGQHLAPSRVLAFGLFVHLVNGPGVAGAVL